MNHGLEEIGTERNKFLLTIFSKVVKSRLLFEELVARYMYLIAQP